MEGCHGTGRSLAQRLVADGELVLEVPARLAARVRVYSSGHGRKTDRHDAVSIGLAALESAGVLTVARDDVAAVRLRIARDHLAGIRALDARLGDIASEVAAMVAQSGSTLTALYGIGPLTAGRILAEAGDIGRFATKDKFASYNGTAPIDVSSGDQVRRRCRAQGTGGSTTRCT